MCYTYNVRQRGDEIMNTINEYRLEDWERYYKARCLNDKSLVYFYHYSLLIEEAKEELYN